MKKEEEEEEKETETNTTTNAKKIPTKEEEEEKDAKVEENENEIPLSSLGKMLESTTSQCVLLFFIFLDVSLTVLAMLMDANAMESTYVVRIAIEAMLLLNLFVFVSEIVALVSVFHYRLLGHIGYIVDILIVGGILYKTVTQSSESSAAFMLRLVGVVRFWRVLRIYYTDLNASKEEVEIALTRVAEVEAEIAKLRMDYDRARNEAKKEIDARRHVEGMLSEYKDRVDYLTEALTIAATTVARAQQREGNEETEEDKKESVATTGTSSPRTLPGIVVSASGSYEIKAKNTRRRRRKKSP